MTDKTEKVLADVESGLKNNGGLSTVIYADEFHQLRDHITALEAKLAQPQKSHDRMATKDLDVMKHLGAELQQTRERLAAKDAALHRISLGAQNSGTSKEDLVREARNALTTPDTGEQSELQWLRSEVERQVRALRERCDQLEIQTDELIDQIERTLHLFGSDSEARAQAEGAIAFARKVRSTLTTEAEQKPTARTVSGLHGWMQILDQVVAPAEDEQPDFCDQNCTWLGHHPECERAEQQEAGCFECEGSGVRAGGTALCRKCNGTGKAQQGGVKNDLR